MGRAEDCPTSALDLVRPAGVLSNPGHVEMQMDIQLSDFIWMFDPKKKKSCVWNIYNLNFEC